MPTTFKNYTGQSNAYPSRWKLAPKSITIFQTTLVSDSARILVTYDCIVNFRGGPIIQGVGASISVAPAFGQILSVGLQTSQICSLNVTCDQGDGNFISILNAAIATTVSPPIFTFRTMIPPCFYVRVTLTRPAGISTTVLGSATMTDY